MSKEVLCNIFSLHGIRNENQIKIKHLDNVNLKEHEYVPDTLINKFVIDKGISGQIYTCNITNAFLMLSTKLPVMYISIINEKTLNNILLFRIYLYFTISEEIKSVNHLLSNNINGKFHLELLVDGKKQELNDDMVNYPGNKKMYKKLTDFVMSTEIKELCKSLVADIDKKMEEEYKKEFEYYKLPTNIISLKNYKLD